MDDPIYIFPSGVVYRVVGMVTGKGEPTLAAGRKRAIRRVKRSRLFLIVNNRESRSARPAPDE